MDCEQRRERKPKTADHDPLDEPGAPTNRCHSHRTTIDASHQKTAKIKPPIHAVASARPPIATAAATRGLRSEPNRARGAGRIAGSSPLTATRTYSRRRLDSRGLGDGAKSPFARSHTVQRREEGRVVEIGPQYRQEHEFGVGRLPEQEIRQPHFAGGADDEIGIRKTSRVESLRQFLWADRARSRRPSRMSIASRRAASTISCRPP